MSITAEISRSEFNKDSPQTKPSFATRWIRQQALFFYFLHIPFKWLRWLFAIALSILTLGLLKRAAEYFLHWSLPDLLNLIVNILTGISGGLCMLSVMLVIFLLPTQVVHLVTSKQTLLLKSFRSMILSHIILVPLLQALVIAGVLSTIGNNPNAPHFINLFWLIFLLLSSFLQVAIYGSQKTVTWPFLMGFMVPVYQYLGYKLNHVDWRLLCIGAIACWIIFTFWWMRWKPLEHRAAIFTDTFTDPTKMQRLQNGFGQGIFAFLQFGLNKHIENLSDGFLLGRAKAPLRIMLAGLAAPLIMISSMAISVAVLPFSSTDTLLQTGQKFTFMFVCLFISMPVQQISAVLFNIKKSWLFFRGKRIDFFSRFEKLILSQTLYQILALLLLMASVAYFGKASESQIKLVCLAVVYGLAQSTFIVYLQLFLYHRLKARRAVSINLPTLVGVALLIPTGMAGAFFSDKMLGEYLSVCLVIPVILFVAGIILRFLTKRQWQKIEFLRVT